MASPDILEYFIGKGNVSFTPTGGTKRHLGNVPEFEVEPQITKKEHKSSMAGVSSTDRTVIEEKSMTVRLVLEEFTPENLALTLLGDVATDSAGEITVDIFSQSEITGALELLGSNDVGAKINVFLPSVSFQPSGGVSFISDDWGRLEITGDVLISAGSFGTIVRPVVV